MKPRAKPTEAPIDLLQADPVALVELEPLDDLLQAVEAIETWSGQHAEVLDYAYRGRVARALVTRADRDALRELHDHLRKVIARARSAKELDAQWVGRWRGFLGVLDARLGALATQDPQGVLERLHVRPILEAVRAAGDEGVEQASIGKKLGLEKANLTRILSLMEANELIARRSEGRGKRVFLGANAPRPASEPAKVPRASSQPQHGKRPLNFFTPPS